MKNFLLLLIGATVFSCEIPVSQSNTISSNEATVNQVNGMYVFVYCQPQANFEVLGSINNDYLEQMKDATNKGNKVAKRLLGALTTTAQNIDFQSKMNNMILLAKDEYPDANGIIFESQMDQAKVVRF